MKVVCFGDSNTYGYDPRGYFGGRYDCDHRWVDLLGRMTGWSMVNEGQNGRCIPGGPLSVDGETDLFLVMLGTNDLLQGRSVSAVTASMERFLSGVGSVPVVLIAPPPMSLGAWVPDSRLVVDSGLLAESYRALAASAGIGFANAGEWKVELSYDGVHFTEQGHIAFAQGLYKELSV